MVSSNRFSPRATQISWPSSGTWAKQVERGRGGQRLGLLVAPRTACRHGAGWPRQACAFRWRPAGRCAGGELRRLRREVAVEHAAGPVPSISGVGERQACPSKSNWPSVQRRPPLPALAHRSHPDVRRWRRLGCNGHVGDGVLHLVVEIGGGQREEVGGLPVDPQLPAFQPLRLQRVVGLRHHGEDHEGAIKLVERRQAQPAIGRSAQRQASRSICTAAPPRQETSQSERSA